MKGSTRYAGVDLGDRASEVFFTDAEGKCAGRAKPRTTKAGFRQVFEGRGSAETFPKKARSELDEDTLAAVGGLLANIQTMTAEVHRLDAEIAAKSKMYPETTIFRQVSGVGPVTALTYRLVIQSPSRFPDTRKVGSYVGLRPRQDQSGERDKQLRITKAGDPYLRTLLVGSAQYILGPFGPDTDLRRWGLKLAERGGKNAKKRAVVAVARKLSVLLMSLWKSGQKYQALRGDELEAA